MAEEERNIKNKLKSEILKSLHPILSREMHAVHGPAFLLGTIDDGLTRGDGSFLVHVEAGTVFGVFQLEGYAVHDVAGYELVACQVEGVTGVWPGAGSTYKADIF